MIFGANIPSELERIKKSLGEEGEKSEFASILLENLKSLNKFQGLKTTVLYFDAYIRGNDVNRR